VVKASKEGFYTIRFNDGNLEEDVPEILIIEDEPDEGSIEEEPHINERSIEEVARTVRRGAPTARRRAERQNYTEGASDSDAEPPARRRGRLRTKMAPALRRRGSDYNSAIGEKSMAEAKKVASQEMKVVLEVCSKVQSCQWAGVDLASLAQESAYKLDEVRRWDDTTTSEIEGAGAASVDISELADMCVAAFEKFHRYARAEAPSGAQPAEAKEFLANQLKACREAEQKARQLVGRLAMQLRAESPESEYNCQVRDCLDTRITVFS